jgi:helicase MOV-10
MLNLIRAIRPSVIVTDLIAIRKPGLRKPVYGGYVTEVQKSDVILQLHDTFSGITGQLWDTRFTVNRLVLRRMHDAVATAGPDSNRILFPEPLHQKSRVTPLPRLSLDRRVNSNPRQRLAVEQIVSLSPGDIPFVIFGP